LAFIFPDSKTATAPEDIPGQDWVVLRGVETTRQRKETCIIISNKESTDV
jgi:hypothetical protein